MNRSLAGGADDVGFGDDLEAAERWGPLWGARATDWAVVEEQQIARRTRRQFERGSALGQVGVCSTSAAARGVFLRAAADRGADVSGIDASEELIAIAPRACPGRRAARRRAAVPAVRRRRVRRRHRLQLVLLRRRHGRGAARGRTRGRSGRSGPDPGLGPARPLRPRRDPPGARAVPSAPGSERRARLGPVGAGPARATRRGGWAGAGGDLRRVVGIRVCRRRGALPGPDVRRGSEACDRA